MGETRLKRKKRSAKEKIDTQEGGGKKADLYFHKDCLRPLRLEERSSKMWKLEGKLKVEDKSR